MLAALMRRRLAAFLAPLLALALASALFACGEEETAPGVAGESVVPEEAVEGEPLELGELSYNVQLTRFLNPDDVEDSGYLAGLPPPPEGTDYLGVFMVIENDGEETVPTAETYHILDTLETEYEPLESESPYALEIGAPLDPEAQFPVPDSTAATGPNQGVLLIFEVAEEIGENRPLVLEVSSTFGTGDVVLDI